MEERHLEKLMVESESLITFASNQADDFLNNAEQTRKESELFMLFFLSIGGFAGLGIGIVLTRSIINPVRIIMRAAEEVATGSLSVNIDMKGKDEISRLGRRFMSMLEEMRKIEGLCNDAALSASLVQNSTNSIMFCDNDLKLIFMNPASIKNFEKLAHLLHVNLKK